MRLLSLLHYDKRSLEEYGVVWTLMRHPSSSSNSQDSPSLTSALFLQTKVIVFVNTLGHPFTFQDLISVRILNLPPSTVLYRSFYLMCAYFYVSVCCIDCGCTVPPAEEERLKSASVCCVHRPGLVGHTLCAASHICMYLLVVRCTTHTVCVVGLTYMQRLYVVVCLIQPCGEFPSNKMEPPFNPNPFTLHSHYHSQKIKFFQ